jgi:pSer/pThr/pTyr-binding forkhead associated (FHA) protein
MLHDTLANPLTPLAKLLIVEGIQKGKEYPLLGTDISFGREKDNTISYPDLSVSRRHFKIHCQDGKFKLEDLGTINGTIVNQKKVSGTINLNHGDQIRIGKSVLQFLMIGKEGEKTPKPTTSHNYTPLIILFGFFLVIVAGSIVYLIIRQSSVSQRDHRLEQIETSRREVIEEIQKGLNFRNKKDWRQAMLAFKLAQQKDPTNFQAQQLLEEVSTELKTDHLINKSKLLIQQESYEEAHKTLTQVEQELAPGSIFAIIVWKLLGDIQKKMPKPKPAVPEKPVEPKPAIPGYDNHKTCESNCRGRGFRCQSKNIRFGGNNHRRWFCYRGRTEVAQRKPTPPSPPPAERDVPKPEPKLSDHNKAEHLYISGDLTAAAQLYGKSGDTERMRQIQKFEQIYKQAIDTYRTHDPNLAIPLLRQAFALDAQISGGRSNFNRQIRLMLSGMYFSKGLLMMSRKSHAEAFRQFQNALRFNPKHTLSHNQLSELRKEAEQWLNHGKNLIKTNPEQGHQYFRKVLRVTSPEDPTHRNAQQLLNP